MRNWFLVKEGMRLWASPAAAGEKAGGAGDGGVHVWGRAGFAAQLLTGDKRGSLQAVLNSCVMHSVRPDASSCLHCYAANNNQSSGRAAIFLGKHLDIPQCIWRASSNFSG